ncbi:sigma-70 family RNA polymerase sigma factor [Streptacidiphilus jiangxiensis]|uniref:RNA polymerase sigma factor n=1 Tax=Streptacidiphilus jiangxiensis TaxID=235985 RepID=A0A1H7MVK5_STRJI|nr:sigma-70 family RNA polymerase sigma factor [Streptacidiphilus jiangxiensis]SEL15386.1 RNA polymerase sigma factor, sigma-70 family [Streptacidiphilus jiangxiensis]
MSGESGARGGKAAAPTPPGAATPPGTEVHTTDVHAAVSAVWRLESARIVAALVRIVRDVGAAEELAQDAMVAALEQWPATGVPNNPAAWLTTIAKRRAVDRIRREQREERKQAELARERDRGEPVQPADEVGEVGDGDAGDESADVLRLLLLTCHPALPPQARIALTLRLLAGLTPDEIARALLLDTTTVTRRIADGKRILAHQRVDFSAAPAAEEVSERIGAALEVVYLVFNEGYAATSGEDLIRPELCLTALRLGRLLARLAPREPEAHALVALMELQASRQAARTGPDGEPVQLHEQNRGRWDPLLIRRGFEAMLRARDLLAGDRPGPPGPYLLQAAIAVCHAQARTDEDTDWTQIAALYQALSHLLPTPVVQLNRAVAVGRAEGPQAGLDLLDSLRLDPTLQDYHLLPSVRADLLQRLGRTTEARSEFRRAAGLTRNDAERAFLLRRAEALSRTEPRGGADAQGGDGSIGRQLGQAADEFLAGTGWGAATRRSYAQTMHRLCAGLGATAPLDEVTADQVARVFRAAWGAAAPATWNRHRATLRSFAAWAGQDALADAVPRRATDAARVAAPTSAPGTLGGGRAPSQAALPREVLRSLLRDPAIPARDRLLWRVLHESGATVTAVLALNVQDVDLPHDRARSGRSFICWRPATTSHVAQLAGGRTSGPLFLSARRPAPARTPADAADLCPQTGRRRLSYERAEYQFKQATRQLDPAGVGFTLRLLRTGR